MDIKKILFVLIIFLAVFLRLFKLSDVPNGFYQDESAIGYNAYSILETGKDEYGKTFPLYFKSFGDYKLPVYIYTTAASIKIFGLNEFAVRFPSAFFGILTVILMYFYAKKITTNKTFALLAMGLLALTPWHLHYNRATFEVSISLFLMLFGAYCMHLAVYDKKKGMFFLATLFFVINIYTYNLTRLLSPAMYFFLIYIYRKDLFTHIRKSEKIITVVASVVIAAPIIFSIFGTGGLSSASGTLLFSSPVTQANILEFRSYVVDVSPIINKTLFNSAMMSSWQYLLNIFSYLSSSFFFINGPTHGNHGIGNYGLFHLFQLPLIIIGIYSLITNKNRYIALLFGWSVITILVAALTREAPHATRSFFLIMPLTFFSVYGALYLWEKVFKSKRKYIKETALALTLCVVGYSFAIYFVSYFVRFPIAYAPQWRSTDKDLALYLGDNQSKYEQVIIDKDAGFIYSSLLFYLPFPPKEFQNTVKRLPDDAEGFSSVESFGKYQFREIDWDKDYFTNTKKVLIVTSVDKKPDGMPILHSFFFPKRPVVIPVNGIIMQYPVQDASYVVVEKR